MPKTKAPAGGLTKDIGLGPVKLPGWGWIVVAGAGFLMYRSISSKDAAAPASTDGTGDPTDYGPESSYSNRGGYGGDYYWNPTPGPGPSPTPVPPPTNPCMPSGYIGPPPAGWSGPTKEVQRFGKWWQYWNNCGVWVPYVKPHK